MVNLKILEELRTKEELINYFKQLGKKITEEEIGALKQKYDQAQESSDALTLQQLDDVAGGEVRSYHVNISINKKKKIDGAILSKNEREFEIEGYTVYISYSNLHDYIHSKDKTTIKINFIDYNDIMIDCFVTKEELDQNLRKLSPSKTFIAEFYSKLGGEINEILKKDTFYYDSFEERQRKGFEDTICNHFKEFLKNNYIEGLFFDSFETALNVFWETISAEKSVSLVGSLNSYYDCALRDITYSFISRELHDGNQSSEGEIREKLFSLIKDPSYKSTLERRMPICYEECLERENYFFNEYLREGFYPDLSVEKDQVQLAQDVKNHYYSTDG